MSGAGLTMVVARGAQRLAEWNACVALPCSLVTWSPAGGPRSGLQRQVPARADHGQAQWRRRTGDEASVNITHFGARSLRHCRSAAGVRTTAHARNTIRQDQVCGFSSATVRQVTVRQGQVSRVCPSKPGPAAPRSMRCEATRHPAVSPPRDARPPRCAACHVLFLAVVSAQCRVGSLHGAA